MEESPLIVRKRRHAKEREAIRGNMKKVCHYLKNAVEKGKGNYVIEDLRVGVETTNVLGPWDLPLLELIEKTMKDSEKEDDVEKLANIRDNFVKELEKYKTYAAVNGPRGKWQELHRRLFHTIVDIEENKRSGSGCNVQ